MNNFAMREAHNIKIIYRGICADLISSLEKHYDVEVLEYKERGQILIEIIERDPEEETICSKQ